MSYAKLGGVCTCACEGFDLFRSLQYYTRKANENTMQELVSIGGYQVSLRSHATVWEPSCLAVQFGEVLLGYLQADHKALELGVGSGVLSIICGLSGASVTGLDLNPQAISIAAKNWVLNGLAEAQADFRVSDGFSGLNEADRHQFDLVFSNPPTLPNATAASVAERSRMEFEYGGVDGREVLDLCIQESGRWLKDDGLLLFIASSRQGWQKTQSLLDKHWSRWSTIRIEELELFPWYMQYVDYWLERPSADGDRIFRKGGKWFSKFYFVKASLPRGR